MGVQKLVNNSIIFEKDGRKCWHKAWDSFNKEKEAILKISATSVSSYTETSPTPAQEQRTHRPVQDIP